MGCVLLLSWDVSEIEIIIIVRKVITCFTNIMLNDYTIAQSDKVSSTKTAKNIKHFLMLLYH